jgi:chorismate dehydratase
LPHQIDLGEAWKDLTGLPFLFAAWMARDGVNLGTLSHELDLAKKRGLCQVDEIISRYATPRGWRADIARKYLTQYLNFDINPAHLEAVRLFHKLAHEHGIIDHAPWELRVERNGIQSF